MFRRLDRKSTRLNSSHLVISYAVFCLKKESTPRCVPGGGLRIRGGLVVRGRVGGSAVRYLFFFNDTATTEIYTLSLHDALPICVVERGAAGGGDLWRGAVAERV